MCGIGVSLMWESHFPFMGFRFEIAEGMVIARTRSIISPIRPGQKTAC